MIKHSQFERSTKPWNEDRVEAPTLFERYQILGIIGQGGMGMVFKGYHLNLKRHVAIKTLRIDKVATRDLISRFRQEMELVGQMDHVNVVRASDAGEKNGVFYLVMEFLAGTDLGTLVQRQGPLHSADGCEVIRQAALGLEYVHQTLVHRDIKPSNLMLTTGGVVKILDLGLARCGLNESSDREQTPEGMPVGTFSYIAPEQAGVGRREIDGRADIYSLGCTLFKLLTGKTPYSGPEYDNAARQIYAHCNVPLRSVEAFHLIPDGIKPILEKMTAKHPEERYRTAGEVAAALTPFLAGSQPARLSVDVGAMIPSVGQPLTWPVPEELSRLTDLPGETSRNTPQGSPAPNTHRPKPMSRRWPTRLGACLITAGLAGLLWLLAFNSSKLSPVPNDGLLPKPHADPVAVPALRALDELAPHILFPLLDLRPFPVGCDYEDPRKWHWDQGQQLVEAKGGDHVLFQLGTTKRSRFTFEAGIAQKPWTGDVGIFWGYREDEAIKKAKTPNEDFAWFQTLSLYRDVGKNREQRYWVRRGKASFRYNHRGEIAATNEPLVYEPVTLGSDEVIVRVEVDGSRLKLARVGAATFPKLSSPSANQMFQSESYEGSLGLVSFSNAAVFGNARVIFHAAK